MRTTSDTLEQGPLGDWHAGLTERRSAARGEANSRWLLSAGVLMPMLVLLWFSAAISGKLLTMIAVAGVIMAGVWGYQPIAAANKSAALSAQSALGKGPDFTYHAEAEAGPEFSAARRYGLVPAFDRAAFALANPKMREGLNISLYDAHLETSRSSSLHAHWDSVFRGTIVRVAFGRAFAATTLLQRAGAHRTWLGLGASRDSINPDGHRLDRVDEVDPEFAEAFLVFSDDAQAARALVQPAYVAWLLELESALGGQELRALFAQNALIVAIEGGSPGAQPNEEAFAALARLAQAIRRAESDHARQIAPQSAPEA
jgi:Protein of unknown function (DUF3137)